MTHASIARLRAFNENGRLKRSEREKPLRVKSRNKAREMPFQMKLVMALRRRLPEGSLVFHPFNRRSSRQEAIFAKAMGAVAGLPDLIVITPGCRMFSIECKAKGGVLSEAQVQIAEQLGRLGVRYFVARDVESALEWIGGFVQLKPAKGATSCE